MEKVGREIFGKEHLVHHSLFAKTEGLHASQLPGMQSFGTARSLAHFLGSVASGNILSERTLKEMVRSRRPVDGASSTNGTQELAAEFKHLLQLQGFDEWGLGAQLISSELWKAQCDAMYTQAWGHLSQTGSAALVLPGKHPKAMALLVNMIDGADNLRICRSVLSLLGKHSEVTLSRSMTM